MNGLYIIGTEEATGKSAIALGAHELLARRVGRLGVFRPVVDPDAPDPVLELLRAQGSDSLPYEASIGVAFDDLHHDADAALGHIVARYRALAQACEGVLVVGTDFTDVGASGELAFNARVASNLGLPVLAMVSGAERDAEEVLAAVELGLSSLRPEGCDVEAVIANRVAESLIADLRTALQGHEPPTYVVPETRLLTAPTVQDVVSACDGQVIGGDEEALGIEAATFVVASMTLPNLLDRLTEGALVITGGDRADVLLGVVTARASGTLPALAGIVLTGGLKPPEQVLRLLEGLHATLPIVLTEHGTYRTARIAGTTIGRITPATQRKIDTALRVLDEHVDHAALLRRFAGAHPDVVTPLMFEYELLDRARTERRHIVLPEDEIRAKAARLRADIDGAKVIDPATDELRERLAEAYARARAHKGVTIDAARDVVLDVSYFGPPVVALGLADGMVSGAVHTTADTIRPALQVIKTQPGVSVVSSVFLMCLRDRVLVYGDCAVNPDPTAEQLADIAISSAKTAAQFGVDPRVAMLSYSTGESGSGAGVDKVREATSLVRERGPLLSVEGPIQYDAAVDASVAKTKLPGSDVAGRATVFIFPDLNTGNNTYKAVQRSAGAVAAGPVLQGLRKPVNDLSCGATVKDIVNTVAMTAIQAQGEQAAPETAPPVEEPTTA